VSSDSLGLHICLALKKNVIGLFGPTPAIEVYMYGCGIAVTARAPYECIPCCKPVCDKKSNAWNILAPKGYMNTLEKCSQGIVLPVAYNYIGLFLTLSCDVGCSYCINRYGLDAEPSSRNMSGEQWVRSLNRLMCHSDIPITLQGGEPSMHPEFVWIINNIDRRIPIDILTNLRFDVHGFIRSVDPRRLRRKAPYPSIRASYHPGYMDIEELVSKASMMAKAGFSIGIFCVDHPAFSAKVREAARLCAEAGIDFRTKEFLGYYGGRLYGTFRYPDSTGVASRKACKCRTSELLIAPDGRVFRCHHDLYRAIGAIGSILDESFRIRHEFLPCVNYGDCNPCDVKVKTNRHQIFGHTSVEIIDIHDS